MSDSLKHECGIALLRLLKPIEYYQEKYGSHLYGFNKLFMLMEKQHNRGQDGSGIGCVKLGTPAGQRYMHRERSTQQNSLSTIFSKQLDDYRELVKRGIIDESNPQSIKEHWKFGAELLLGHLRYGTSGGYGADVCHPYVRRSNWPTRSLMLAGNFTMTNATALNEHLIGRGQHPIFDTDTQVILEVIGHQLDEEHSNIYRELRDQNLPGTEIPARISEQLDPATILQKASEGWDGGYVIAGLVGNGDAFVMRDEYGIRPGFYYQDDEIVAVTSERGVLMTVFNLQQNQVQELPRGGALIIKSNGHVYTKQIKENKDPQGCSFERIYFSRGNDPEIYKERKALGAALAEPIFKSIHGDLKNTVFGFIPNTAEPAFYGMMSALRERRRLEVKQSILDAQTNGLLTESLLDELIMKNWPRQEKIAIKDIKLRTFISQEDSRTKLASHVYDVTYGIIKKTDTLVCIDDSIVRGTTLKQSILRILSRTHPKKIIIVSTAPQIRYPDCYGIDMSEMGKFVAFQAIIQLLNDNNKNDLLEKVYQACIAQKDGPTEDMKNHVKQLYDAFPLETISKKIAEIVFPDRSEWQGEVEIIFESIESLHESLIHPCGDWYFTGKYPTPGGYASLNNAFINFYENKEGRSY